MADPATPAEGEVRVYTIFGPPERLSAPLTMREIARAATREILAASLGVQVGAIELQYGAKGKPTLRTDPSLYFSVSHADAVSMVAVTRVAPVGVDVERVRAVPRAEAILRRFFPQEEVESILAAGERDLRFVRAWTHAEATVKVRGASLWEAATPDPSVTVRDIEAPDGYAASVAVAAREWYVTQHPWRPAVSL